MQIVNGPSWSNQLEQAGMKPFEESSGPALCAVKVYVTCSPITTGPSGTVFVSDRSACGTQATVVVTSWLVLLSLF